MPLHAIGLLAALAAGSQPANPRIILATTTNASGSVAVAAAGRIVARFPVQMSSQASTFHRRLVRALSDGLKPSDIQTRRLGRSALLLARGRLLVTITPSLAAARGLSPMALARAWAKNIAELVARPYLAPDRPSLRVPLGETRSVRLGGTAPASRAKISVSPPEIAAAELRSSREILVRGLAAGQGHLVISAGPNSARIPLAVRPLAAHIKRTVPVQAVNQPQSSPLGWALIRRLALASAILAHPAATVSVRWASSSFPSASATVAASGKDLFDASAPVQIVALRSSSAPPAPSHVAVSNDPEKLSAPALLLRDLIRQGASVRLLWHHVATRPGLWLCLRLHNLSSSPATIFWSGYSAGPVADEIYAGHLAAREYLRRLLRRSGWALTLPPSRAVCVFASRLRRGEIISGLATIACLRGGPIVADIAATSQKPPFGARPSDLPKTGPKNLTPYRFGGTINLQARYRIGSPWLFLHIGRTPRRNKHGHCLPGNYGVLYRIRLTLENPSPETRLARLRLRPAGGPARATLILNGRLLESPFLAPGCDWLVDTYLLPPSASKTLTILTMPQAGSNYPVTLIAGDR